MSSFTRPGAKANEAKQMFIDEGLKEAARNIVDEVMADTKNLDKYVTTYLVRNKDSIRDTIDIQEDYEAYLLATNKVVDAMLLEFIEKTRNENLTIQDKFLGMIDYRLKEIEKQFTRVLEIRVPNKKPVKVKNVHTMFEDLVIHATERDHVMMSGPAGSGKGTATRQLAEVLKLPYYSKSCSIQDTLSQWAGYKDAAGKYQPSLFRLAYENGGVFLADEFDRSNALVSTALNAALADGIYGFPDRMVKMHDNFVFLAAANTWGYGGDGMYVGANQLDAATLDRFSFLAWDYDEGLEMKVSPVPEWTRLVQDVRKSMFKKNLQYVISPRASIQGGKLLQAGLSLPKVIERRLFKAWDKDSITIVKKDSQYEAHYVALREALKKAGNDESN